MVEKNETGLENKNFWNELCGSHLFNFLGLKHITKDNLKIFDDYYFNMYSYLKKYVAEDKLKNKSVLEIGLGFGTLSQYIFSNSASYVGVDYSDGPVNIVNDRAKMTDFSKTAYAVSGDARNLNFGNESFDTVVSIGCLHHTGDTKKSIQEVYRVLKKGGYAIIMLYNKNSFRKRVSNPYKYFLAKKRKKYFSFDEYSRASYDANSVGDAAPIVDLYTKRDIKKLFSDFDSVTIKKENFDNYQFYWRRKEIYWPRENFLNNVARVMGLDLYIVARK